MNKQQAELAAATFLFDAKLLAGWYIEEDEHGILSACSPSRLKHLTSCSSHNILKPGDATNCGFCRPLRK